MVELCDRFRFPRAAHGNRRHRKSSPLGYDHDFCIDGTHTLGVVNTPHLVARHFALRAARHGRRWPVGFFVRH
ncbi:hypothetical protein PGTUg99_020567 [Puccinia graminis f. sp. tritici]|uniref:Uncharacterized protein n=1 Tax=Puccinia graminis f. sp. tritici TaxID=56615 RepID=A0A5B0RXK9_PUCGR|nr:hypothetical protein PGTUg99_020567 [Puccinia graminis f. sp. tritici]